MYLHTKFPSTEILIHGVKNEGVTGRFEVTVGDRLIHSKASGSGKAESTEERDNIVLAIKNVLASRYVDFSITGNDGGI